MKLLKAECKVNQRERGEKFKCYSLANDDGYVVLEWAAEDREGWRRCQKPAPQQKTTDDNEED